MNNREAYNIIRKVLPDLVLDVINHGINADPSYTYGNLVKYRKAFKVVQDSGLISPSTINEAAGKLKILLEGTEDKKPLSFIQGYTLEAEIKTIYSILGGLYEFVSSQLADENPDTLSVKIQKIEDLDELEKIANMLKRSFHAPVIQMGGYVTVDGLENGSAWIILGVKDITGNALKLCANLIWSAVVIFNKREQLKENQEYNKEIKLPDSVTKQILEFQTSYINDSILIEANSIAKEFIKEDDIETIGRLKLALETIGDLIEKGVEFYPSIEASKEIKSLFPDPKTMKLIESKILLIKSGERESD